MSTYSSTTPLPSVRVNGIRLNSRLQTLAEIGRSSPTGVSRVAYSEFDRTARSVVTNWMREAKLDVSVDYAGNIIGRRAGSNPALKPIVTGSHIDTVPNGGRYDGTVGVVGAIEAAEALAEHNVSTEHPLEVVVWQNEESGHYGSKAVAGHLTEQDLKAVNTSGKTVAEGIKFLGGDVSRLKEVVRAPGSIAAYLELHIEQGGSLARADIPIGIVDGIVAIKQWEVTIAGVQNHAGATAMADRHDPVLSAARFIEAVHRIVTSTDGTRVGTVGRCQAVPGVPNVIAGSVNCTLELRDLDQAVIDRTFARIQTECTAIAAMNGTSFRFADLYSDHSAPGDPLLRTIIRSVAEDIYRLKTQHMPSGAGHDAQELASLGPMGMIFIPSRNGVSHSPDEFSTPEHIITGTNVLLTSILSADQLLQLS